MSGSSSAVRPGAAGGESSSSIQRAAAGLFKRKRPTGWRIPSSANNANGTAEVKAKLKALDGGKVRLDAPGTPWHELDLSESFLADLQNTTRRQQSWFYKRRLFFLFGGLLGGFAGWLFTGGPSNMLSGLDFGDLSMSLGELRSISDLAGNFGINFANLTESFTAPAWLQSRDFKVGRQARDAGLTKEHAVMFVPGIVSSGLESWTDSEEHAPWFRKRIWGTTSMVRAIITQKKEWLRALTLDPVTGLDGPGVKVRSAQGLDAAAFFVTGYWIWSKIIENLSVLGYDHNDMHMAAFDWRLSYGNLQVRDKLFSRMKMAIEHNKLMLDKKTVLIGHSMGSQVVLYFLKWVEAEGYGNGGDKWVEDHIAAFVNVAGTMLGVPKAMSALLSGEMRDTVELPPAGVYLLEKFFSRRERVRLFRSWAGASSMLIKGGNAVWGDTDGAPDDPENATLSNAYIYSFKQDAKSELSHENVRPNLTLDAAMTYLLQHSPDSYQKMLASNYSFGLERDVEQIKRNDRDPRTWSNPLEVRLPNAPSMSIYCLYGWGKPTERGYFYKAGPLEAGEELGTAACTEPGGSCAVEDSNMTSSSPVQLPTRQRVYIDNAVNLESTRPQVKSGVLNGEGDGTVSLLSLGAMCVDGWKRDRYNPARIPVTTHEILHNPEPFDPRGGAGTGDHIDILGSNELNRAILRVAAGQGELVKDKLISPIVKYAAKIKWDAPTDPMKERVG
ncbi:uncharacterized protein L969DRAFT_17065 [Mixia osmundae IAM 14324]|uniref:Phospholipid:diacylglycerol acyltransferase n=1 Tax=Mixia osmundae (strain CBS 9802 / IAM 14324 / JCM 22182 / KY 12970) TaxID=764103 RepID=G7E6G9_MIXOS|nr:uncharacterized protein L969DRAFT_17065 [Mixia osmundae IAM 14324]KEI40414.1 hypothetical protein L969DRAFT_17065 [Mixia osmundae IAM 14324]GAA98429.1 hypothetical protein E5Q_05115 [Mixia osmundae IAM 14324]